MKRAFWITALSNLSPKAHLCLPYRSSPEAQRFLNLLLSILLWQKIDRFLNCIVEIWAKSATARAWTLRDLVYNVSFISILWFQVGLWIIVLAGRLSVRPCWMRSRLFLLALCHSIKVCLTSGDPKPFSSKCGQANLAVPLSRLWNGHLVLAVESNAKGGRTCLELGPGITVSFFMASSGTALKSGPNSCVQVACKCVALFSLLCSFYVAALADNACKKLASCLHCLGLHAQNM